MKNGINGLHPKFWGRWTWGGVTAAFAAIIAAVTLADIIEPHWYVPRHMLRTAQAYDVTAREEQSILIHGLTELTLRGQISDRFGELISFRETIESRDILGPLQRRLVAEIRELEQDATLAACTKWNLEAHDIGLLCPVMISILDDFINGDP